MPIIGLSGKRGAGKTALQTYLVSRYKFKPVSFAAPLRELAEQMFPGVTKAPKEKPFGKYEWSPRDFMIHLGEFARFHEPDYWLQKGLLAANNPKETYVFDDVRFTNEADALRGLGAKIVRINRFEKDNPYGKNLDIESETQLDNYKFDFIIHDCVNTTLRSLYNQGDRMVKDLL